MSAAEEKVAESQSVVARKIRKVRAGPKIPGKPKNKKKYTSKEGKNATESEATMDFFEAMLSTTVTEPARKSAPMNFEDWLMWSEAGKH